MKTLSLAATCLLAFGILGCQAEAPRTVTVQAEGAAVSQATHATVRLSIGSRGETRDTALRDLQTLYTSMHETLPQLEGLDSIEIETFGLEFEQVCPRNRDYDSYSQQGIPCEDGYHTAVQPVVVNLAPAEQAGNLMSLANELGAMDVNLIRFTVAEQEALQDQAMEQALQLARQSAERIARSSDLQLGQLVSVQPSVTSQAMPLLSSPRDEIIVTGNLIRPRHSVDVAPGEVSSTARITVVYELIESSPEN